jgi:hypothetical protein
MKETIYTIPVNEAFDKGTECAVCELEKDLESSNVGFVTGPALMEPGVRMEMNKKGFCRRHYTDLLGSQKNILGLSLILTSRYEEVMYELEKKTSSIYEKLVKAQKQQDKNRLSRELSDMLIKRFRSDSSSCFICDRIDFTMDKYFDVLFYMWKTDAVFRKKLTDSKGFCNRHTESLLEYAGREFKNSDYSGFITDLYVLFSTNWKRNEEDLRWFTKKFDYRYKDEPWKDSKDAVARFIQKIVGFIDRSCQK